ncbi:MAG: undecaprenyldiphospho-muramoylpentapeptide beta-N-acetylglucosaminyltransferase [Leptospirillia bacterium]
MKVLIAGGGTGGHLFPGMAVAEAFTDAAPDTEVAFAGTDRGIEARVIPNTHYRLFTLPVFGVVGVGWLRQLFALSVLPSAIAAAGRVLRAFRPDLVVGVGGYASAPVLFMAGIRKIPRVMMEQNAVPGLTNRIFGPTVERVFLTVDEARSAFKGGTFSCPGNPVRKALLTAAQEPPTDDGMRLLVFGGSQGALAVNEAMEAALPELLDQLPELTVTWQTGRHQQERWEQAAKCHGERVTVLPFIDDMGAAYAGCDLVLCRSGATTVAEITCLGKPAILVPLPSAAHDHQSANARVLDSHGAARLLPQDELSGERLTETVVSIFSNRDELAKMEAASRSLGRPGAAREIVAECLKMLTPVDRQSTP